MSKDRSISGGTTALGPGGFQPARGAGGGNRLPTAPRERKPALAALAVLLILAGSLATFVLVQRSGNRIDVIEITTQVAAGQPIPKSAMADKQVAADTSIHYVLYSQVPTVATLTTSVALVPGTILIQNMLQLGDQQKAAPNQDTLSVVLKPGQYPKQRLTPGDVVDVYTPPSGSSTGTGSTGTGGSSIPVKLCSATVLLINGPEDTLVVNLAVDKQYAGAVLGAGGNLYLVKPGS